MNLLGIDIGGTKVALCLMDEEGRVLQQMRYPHRKCETGEWLAELMAQVEAFLARHQVQPDAIGVGARGHVDYRRQLLVSATNMLLQEPLDLCSVLAERYHCPAYIDNDAKAAATLELLLGAGREQENFVCYSIGTGIGSCVVMDGRILRGDHNFSGEIGYDCVVAERGTGVPEGALPASYLERLAGGAGLQAAYRDGVQAETAGTPVSVDLFQLEAAGDAHAAALVERAAGLIAVSIYNLHNVLDISHFVFSGGLAGQQSLLDRIEKKTRQLVDQRPGPKEIHFSVSCMGSQDAGALGAACVALYGMRKA